MKGTFTPTRRDNACVICDNIDGRCRQTESLSLCMNVTDQWSARSLRGFQFLGTTKDNLWGKFVQRDDDLAEQDREAQRLHWQQVKAVRAAEEQQRHAVAMPAQERDRHYRKLLSQLSLHPLDRADLHRRGLSDEQIEAGGFRSVEQWQRLEFALPWTLPGVNLDSYSLNAQPGYLCPIHNVDGLLVGFQVRLRDAEQGGRYRWLSSRTKKRQNGATAHLPNGENPIAVAHPAITGGDLRTGKLANGKLVSSVVGIAEGILKPFIVSRRLNQVMLGAAGGQFASSPQTLKETLDRLAAEFGFPPSIVFYPDAEAVQNEAVLKQYSKTWKLLKEWGYRLHVGWWGQFTKSEPDIDELEDLDSINHISTEQFWELVRNRKREQCRAVNAKIQQQLNSLTHEPTLKLNQQYLSDIHLPADGGYLFISSPMGTGKTTQLASLISEYRSRRPEGKIRSIGHRNGLLRQTGEKLGIPLLVDLDFEAKEGKLTSVGVGKLPATGLCINSLLRLDVDFLDGALLIFDEIDAILKNLLTSKLLKSKRAHIMAHLQRIVQHVLKTGGYVIGMEANLTDLSIDFLRGIGGTQHPMQLVVNEWQGQPWNVTVYGNSGATWMQAIARFPGKQVVMTDSQKFAEELERLAMSGDRGAVTLDGIDEERRKPRVLRVDGKTAEREDVRAFVANPDAYISKYQPDMVILSPSLESGGDIAIRGQFDRVAFNLCNLETRSQMQMLGRVRDPIPRVGIVKKFAGSDETGRSLNPETIRNDLYKNAEALATFTQLAQTLEQQGDSEAMTFRDRLTALLDPGVESAESFWVDAYCRFKARESGARVAMAENLIDALRSAGHSITLGELPKCKEDAEIRAELRTELEREQAAALAAADDGGLTPQMAREMLESTGTTEADRFAARKAVLRDSLPGVELTEEFIFKNIVQESGTSLKAATLLWQCQNIELVKELDRRAFKRELEKPFVYTPDLKTRSLKASLLDRSGLVQLIGDRPYQESDEDLQRFKKWALWNRFEIRRLLGMTISDKLTAIAIFCKFARKLGYDLDSSKKGKRGEQIRLYRISNLEDSDRSAILAALTRKYAELVPQDAQNVSDVDTVSTTFPFNTSSAGVDTKAVDTGGTAAEIEEWLTPESLADVRMWLADRHDPAIAELLNLVPAEALRRAIA